MCGTTVCCCCKRFPFVQAVLTTVVTGLVSLLGNAYSSSEPSYDFTSPYVPPSHLTSPYVPPSPLTSSCVPPSHLTSGSPHEAPCCKNAPIIEEEEQLADCCYNNESISKEQTALRVLPVESMPNSNSDWMLTDYDGSFASLPYYKVRPLGKWFDRINIQKDEDFHYVKVLGKGKYGEVSAAVLDGRLVALKQLYPSNTSDEDILWEAEMLWRATNIEAFPNLIGFTHNEIGGVEMVMDFVGDIEQCSTVSMLTSLQDDNPRLSYVEWVGISWDIVKGLGELHRLNLLHCDIKAANIMLTWHAMEMRWIGRIVDVGLVCLKDPAPPRMRLTPEEQAKYVGACTHIAPEVVRGTASYTSASDVYAVGTLLCLIAVKIKDNAFKRLGVMCRDRIASRRPTIDEVTDILDEMWETYN